MSVTVETEVSLGQLIRDVSEHMDADARPEEIAQAVIDKAGDDLASVFLLELVTEAVRNTLSGQRRGALSQGGSSDGGTFSHKQARVRDWWQRALNTRYPVGGGNWKLLRDCTVDDLLHCIAEREAMIERTRAQIDKLNGIVTAMREHNAATAGDLSAEQVIL